MNQEERMNVEEKRALIITPFLPNMFSGGVERFNLYLERYLKTRGYSVDYITKDNINSRKTIIFKKIEEEILSWKTGRYASNLPANLVISNGYYGWGYKGRGRHINVYHGTVCGYVEAQKEWPLLRALKAKGVRGYMAERLSGKGAECVAVSEKVAEEVLSYYGFNCEIIENAVDTEKYKDVYQINMAKNKENLSGIFVGTADKGKGYGILKKIINEYRDIEWTVVLGGQDLLKPNIGMNARVISKVAFLDMPDYYKNVDFLLLPTNYEGLSYVVLESLACGIIPITTQAGGNREIANNDLLAPFIVPVGSEGEIYLNVKKALDNLINLGDERARIAECARQTAVSRYNLDRWYEQWDEMLEGKDS